MIEAPTYREWYGELPWEPGMDEWPLVAEYIAARSDDEAQAQ